MRGQRTCRASRIGEPACEEREALPPGTPGGDAADVSSQHLPARAHDDRSHRGVVREVVAADQAGGLGRICCAAEETEERELVDGADDLRRRTPISSAIVVAIAQVRSAWPWG